MSAYICPYGSDNSQSEDESGDNGLGREPPKRSLPKSKEEDVTESRSVSYSPGSSPSRGSSASGSPADRQRASRGGEHHDRGGAHSDRGRHSPHSKSKHRRSRSPDSRRKRSYSRERSSERYHRKKDRRRRSRSPYKYDRSKRSRSREGRYYRDRYSRKSRDRSRTPPRSSSIPDRPNKLSVLEKLGIDLKVTNDKSLSVGTLPASYAEKIAKRKMLWSCNQKQVKEEAAEVKNSSVWQGTKFAQDQDGKMTAKFHRLMGMKSAPQGEDTPSGTSSNASNILKKQEELFSSMELQYEVARATTHTQRGVGLGFGTHYLPKQ